MWHISLPQSFFVVNFWIFLVLGWLFKDLDDISFANRVVFRFNSKALSWIDNFCELWACLCRFMRDWVLIWDTVYSWKGVATWCLISLVQCWLIKRLRWHISFILQRVRVLYWVGKVCGLSLLFSWRMFELVLDCVRLISVYIRMVSRERNRKVTVAIKILRWQFVEIVWGYCCILVYFLAFIPK